MIWVLLTLGVGYLFAKGAQENVNSKITRLK